MDRREFIGAIGTAGLATTAGCAEGDEDNATTTTGDGTADETETGDTENGGSDPIRFRVGADGFERWRGDRYRPVTVRGVNLGMAKPGYFPGEAAITREEYDRWLAAIGDIANVVRTYTIHPPAFYRALAAYNDQASNPLLLLQGTWVPTNDLLEAGDATALSGTVDAEIERTVDAVHGDRTLEKRPGHAAGTYDADISEFTLGFVFGIEWPPEVVRATNEEHSESAYAGTYLETSGGAAFEQWLAGRLDRFVSHEMGTYGTQRPVSFVNWVTADPLTHPYEPFPDEDRVSVNPDTIRATDAFDAGTLASYHVYPYYPDLLNETPKYRNYTDHRGEANNYAGYLGDLLEHTDHPVLIAEFGVPSSRGIAHRNVHGRDQGRHTEREQGEIVAAMFADITRADTAGGIVFAWQNEWFKRTWNLASRSVPGRRPHWSNVETPEQRFGLLAFDPVDGVSLDGSASDWENAETTVSSENTGTQPSRTLTTMQVTHDVEGLNYRLEFDGLDDPVDWTELHALVTIGLTGRKGTLPFETEIDATADFVVSLGGPEHSRLLVDSRYDAFAREFGNTADLPIASYRDGSAGFVPVREPVNRGYTVPANGKKVPFDAVETGQLRYGNGNPDAPSYDSLTDVHVDTDGNAIEGRLPWVLLNVADPSSKQRIATAWDAGLDTVEFDSLSVGALTYTPRSSDDRRAVTTAGVTNTDDHLPGLRGSTLDSVDYEWEDWYRPDTQERLKESYEVLQRRLG